MSSVITAVLCVTVAIIYQTGGQPAGKCNLGEDIFNILYNSTMRDTGEYGVDGAVGFVGNKQELLDAINQVRRNFTLADLEACLELFKEPPPFPQAKPSSSAASNLGYNRPDFLGGVQNIPVPQPPFEDFNYGHGYTTYQRPFFIGQRVKEYQPNDYQKANSVQDLFQIMYTNFRKEWDTLFDGRLRPNYWNNYPNKKTRRNV